MNVSICGLCFGMQHDFFSKESNILNIEGNQLGRSRCECIYLLWFIIQSFTKRKSILKCQFTCIYMPKD